MKIRIKGNSIRVRLTKTEVSKISTVGYLEERTDFGMNSLIYALAVNDKIDELSASFEANKITIYVPATFIKDWPTNDVITLDTNMHLSNNGSLYLKLEKDFVCLDHTTEDQSDNYENPNKTC